MLAPADADLARRDPALPGLATLLDPDAFAAAAGRPGPARVTYIRYKPGTSCVVAYRFAAGPDAVGRAVRPDAHDKLAKAAAEPGQVLLADRAVAVVFFPDDDALAVLPRLMDADGRESFLRKLLPDRADLWGGAVEAVRYKPGRRYVGRLEVGGTPRAALKVYAPVGYGPAEASAKAVRPCPAFRLPARLGRSARHSTIALEWLPGRPLHEALAGPAFDPRPAKAVGAALAALHAQRFRRLIPRTRAEEAATLPPVAAWLGRVCPGLAGRARRLAARVAERIAALSPEARPVHGDFYAKQVMVGAGAVGLLDFDEAFRGDPAHDLGSFLAHLRRDALRGAVPVGRVAPARAALLAGYGPHPADRVALYAAAGLLRLAPHPFRDREPDWPARTAELLDAAEAELADSAAPRPVPAGGPSR